MCTCKFFLFKNCKHKTFGAKMVMKHTHFGAERFAPQFLRVPQVAHLFAQLFLFVRNFSRAKFAREKSVRTLFQKINPHKVLLQNLLFWCKMYAQMYARNFLRK